MVDCLSCGVQNPDTNRFCGGCGNPMSRLCDRCGTSNPGDTSYCGQCGSSLAPVSASTPPSRSEVIERRHVTVLFADLANYTTFSEGRDPEDVRNFLTAYFEAARDVIGRFGGTVDKFIGDAVMAVWGATTTNEDDAERAVRAGLELVDVAAKLIADIGATDMGLRVGVHTGEASVGPGGNEMGLVAGDNVNVAARLQTAAEPGTVLVGGGTFQATSASIAYESMGDLTVKGKEQPVGAWRALRVVAERAGTGRSNNLEPPFCGRAEEIRLLKDLLTSVGRDQRSRLVSVLGEAGIGKSRLAWEFRKYVDGLVEDVYWHEGRSPAYGDGVTFWAAAEMIRSRAGIAETDTEDDARTALRQSLEALMDPTDIEWVEPRLAAVLGLSPAPSGDRAELDAAIRLYFGALSTRGTTVMVFEDLHWADSGLLDFVEEVTGWWRDRPILCLALARPDLTDRRPSWGAGKAGMITIRLGPLADAEMAAMVTGTVPGLPDAAVEAIVERAAGVPMYAVELLRMLIAQGDVAETDGEYALVSDLDDLAVPESLQAAIGARLDRLAPADRTLLQDAAVLGQAFTREGLGRLAGLSDNELDTGLATLTRRELIEPVRDPRSPLLGQYRFLQSLIRDVALGRMSRDERRRRHLEVAEYYAELVDPGMSVVVASHYLAALDATPDGPESDGLRSSALASMSAAADRASELGSFEQVMTIGERALALAGSPAQRAPFWEVMAGAATTLGERGDPERYGRLALDHYRETGDEVGVDRMTRVLGFAFLEDGRPHLAEELIAPHLESRGDIASNRELAMGASVLARAIALQLRLGEAVVAADRALDATERLGLVEHTVDALITRATCLGSLGRLVEARIVLEGVVDMADHNDLLYAAMRARNNLSYLFGISDPLGSLKLQEEIFETAKRTGHRSVVMFQASNLAPVYAGDFQFEALATLLGDPVLEGAPDHYLGGILNGEALGKMLQGDFAEATVLFARSAELFAEEENPQIAAIRAESELAIAFIDGRLDEASDAALGVISEPGAFAENMWASYSIACLRDRARAARYASILTASETAYHTVVELWSHVAATPEGEPLDTSLVHRVVADADRRGSIGQAINTYLVAAQFGPRDHPDRERYLDEARRRASEHGAAGIITLIERHIA